MPIQVAATPLTANGNADIDIGAGYVGRPITFRASVAGTGAVAGSIAIHQGSEINGVVVYDATAATGDTPIVLTGTTVATDSVSFEATGNRFWRCVLSGISGTGATVRIVAEVV